MGIAALQKNKRTLGLLVCLSTVIFILFVDVRTIPPEFPVSSETAIQIKPHIIATIDVEKWWLLRNSSKNLSKLGEVLFLDKPEPKIDSSKKYTILVWKYGHTIENRHFKHFSGQRIDPFGHCPVKNCDITYEDDVLDSADMVIFHLHRIKGINDMPKRTNLQQIWTFLTDESPHNTFLYSKGELKDFNGIFNWSMTYRMDSDIPVPYGRTVRKKYPLNNLDLAINKRRDVLVAILGSNCDGDNNRWRYVKELQKHLRVDVYGGCGTFKKECPGHFGDDCPAINQYLFYLSFENSNCNEYITEKLWWNAYTKNSIPIVMGSDIRNYKKLLPVNSYINTEDFANPAALAQYIMLLNKTGDFKKFYNWKSTFEILNEHGYFKSKSYHYCRACQALNYNEKKNKVYDHLEKFWNEASDCHPAWDQYSDDDSQY